MPCRVVSLSKRSKGLGKRCALPNCDSQWITL